LKKFKKRLVINKQKTMIWTWILVASFACQTIDLFSFYENTTMLVVDQVYCRAFEGSIACVEPQAIRFPLSASSPLNTVCQRMVMDHSVVESVMNIEWHMQ
jgi:hypothetical protein